MSDFEYVLIGSGVSATLIADTLLKRDSSASILMLEAGGTIALRDRSSWWELALRGQTPYSNTYDVEGGTAPESVSSGGTKWLFKESRVRAYGGTTMHWGGWALRFQVEDFECATRTGRGADWPFGYSELEPWYERAEEVLSVGGQANDGDCPPRRGAFPLPAFPWTANESDLAGAFEKNGLKPGHMPIARFHRCMTTGTCKYCPIGSRFTAQDYLAGMVLREHKGFVIKTGAVVEKILAEKQRVTGVEYLSDGKKETATAKCIVVCAGSYESPKLLMRSVSTDWPQGVGNKYDQVGRYLVTHSMLRVKATAPSNPNRWFQEYDFPTLMSRSWDSQARQRRGKVFVFNNRSLPKLDLAALMIDGARRGEVDAAAYGPRQAGLDAFIEEFGLPENRVMLGKATGMFGLPSTEVSFTHAPDMQPTSIKVLDDMAKILTSLGYQFSGDPKEKEIQDPRGDHSIGTCRMGISEAESVTDANLKVHGLDNLYVCSNAVMPTATAVNPTLTLSALSLRLGTHLAASMNLGTK